MEWSGVEWSGVEWSGVQSFNRLSSLAPGMDDFWERYQRVPLGLAARRTTPVWSLPSFPSADVPSGVRLVSGPFQGMEGVQLRPSPPGDSRALPAGETGVPPPSVPPGVRADACLPCLLGGGQAPESPPGPLPYPTREVLGPTQASWTASLIISCHCIRNSHGAYRPGGGRLHRSSSFLSLSF